MFSNNILSLVILTNLWSSPKYKSLTFLNSKVLFEVLYTSISLSLKDNSLIVI